MKKLLSILLLALFIISCSSSGNKNSEETHKNSVALKFDSTKSKFIDELWELYPIWASYVGYHAYDAELPIPDNYRREKEMTFASFWKNELEQFSEKDMEANDLTDLYMMRDFLEGIEFSVGEFMSYHWNPASYNLGGAFYQVLNYRQDPLEKRLENLDTKMSLVIEYYDVAKSNIKKPTKVHTELAISQLKGSLSIFNTNMIDSLEASSHSEEFKSNFRKKVDESVAAINGFISYLENDVLANLNEENSRSFRIGKNLFEKKFSYDIQSEYSAEEIFQTAVEEKAILHDKMFQLSDMLWKDYFGDKEKPGKRLDQIRMVIDEVSKKHVHRDSFITAIRQQIPQLEAFIKENDLLDLDPNKPLVVRETPKYMQGVAGASISAPGPYDKDAETYYNVTPLDHYSAEEAESYLREYNYYVLQVLNIHEAIPGHYAQLVYSNESPSLIKSILGNGAMVEGWAVYTEKMMLEAGYGGDHLEMGLMYYKWNLRTVCNTILDFGVHVNNFTEEDAMQLLLKEAFQQEAEAKGKWKRARLSQVQLCSYFTGYYEIMKLREEIMELDGEAFNLKSFHEEFLSYGSAPVKYIKKMMLNKRKNSIKSTTAEQETTS